MLVVSTSPKAFIDLTPRGMNTEGNLHNILACLRMHVGIAFSF